MNRKKKLSRSLLFIPLSIGFSVFPALPILYSKNQAKIILNNNEKINSLNTNKKYDFSSVKVAFSVAGNTTNTPVIFFINKDVDKEIENDYKNVERKIVIWEKNKNDIGYWVQKATISNPGKSIFKTPDEYNDYFGYVAGWNETNYKYEFSLEYRNGINLITSVRLDENNNIVSVINPDGYVDKNTSIEKNIPKHIHDLNKGIISVYPEWNNAINFSIDKKEFDAMDYYHSGFKTKLVVWEKPKHSNDWEMKKSDVSPVFWFGMYSKSQITYRTSGILINNNAYDYEFSLEYYDKYGDIIASLRVDLNNKIIQKTTFDGDKVVENNPNDDNLNIDKNEQSIETKSFITLLAILVPLLVILIINLILFSAILNKRRNTDKKNQDGNDKKITIQY